MNVLPDDLRLAALDARDQLGGLARRAASTALESKSGLGPAAAMGAAARAAVFADALLGAIRARLDELRGVAK